MEGSLAARLAAPFSAEIGGKLIMEIGSLNTKLSSIFVGYVRNRYLAVQIPYVPDANKDFIFQYMQTKNKVTVRYMHLGSVMGFSSYIIKYILTPFPLLFMTFPAQVEIFNLRKQKRISCLFPITVGLRDAELPGMITDLTTDGCGAFVNVDGFDELTLNVNDQLLLKCPAFGAGEADAIRCDVRRAVMSGDKLELGLRFSETPPAVFDSIENYLREASMYVES